MVALRFSWLGCSLLAQAIALWIGRTIAENSYISLLTGVVNFPASVVLTNVLATAFNA
jgi:hypothetical protein